MPNRESQYSHLLSPGRIGTMEVRNRIIMAPMGTYLAARDGTIVERFKSYYEARARGGVGLIIAGVFAVDHPRGKCMTRQAAISDDKFIPGLADLAGAVHRHGAKLAVQLQHGGRIAAPFLSGGHEAVSASNVPLVPAELGSARELTLEEISHLVQAFAQAAGRAQQAGIDGVEIHAGHGYLIDQFLSRSVNRRQDAYGGSLSDRSRFLMEILAAVRQTVGRNYPVWCRIDGQEFAIENGITGEEAQEIARLTESAGADAVHVSGYGGSQGLHFTDAPLVNIPGYLVPLARELKKKVKIPVITVGRLDHDSGEKVISQGDADFIAFGRPLLADPELPSKLIDGQIGDIRKCIYCYTCVHQIFVRNNVCCAVNPSTGKESEPVPARPERPRKVVIIGGGPAGLEAARTAATRGHRVILCEKENRLGGSLLLASVVRSENEELVKYYNGQMKKLNVEVKLGTKLTPDSVKLLQPDVIVLATGSTHQNPTVPGIEGPNVIDGNDLREMLSGSSGHPAVAKLSLRQKAILYPGRNLFHSFFTPRFLRQVTKFWLPLKRRIVILGGGMVGCELAIFLAERRRKVTILENSDQMATEMSLPLQWITQDKMEKLRVSILSSVKYEQISAQGVDITTKDGSRRTIEADNIIVATGTIPDNTVLEAFRDCAPEIYPAGDCSKLSYIKDSVAGGLAAALAIK